MDSQILRVNFVDRDVNVEVVRIAVYNADALMFAVAELGAKTFLNRLEGNGAKISIAFVEDGGELHAFYDGVLSGMDKPWGGVSWLLARNG